MTAPLGVIAAVYFRNSRRSAWHLGHFYFPSNHATREAFERHAKERARLYNALRRNSMKPRRNSQVRVVIIEDTEDLNLKDIPPILRH